MCVSTHDITTHVITTHSDKGGEGDEGATVFASRVPVNRAVLVVSCAGLLFVSGCWSASSPQHRTRTGLTSRRRAVMLLQQRHCRGTAGNPSMPHSMAATPDASDGICPTLLTFVSDHTAKPQTVFHPHFPAPPQAHIPPCTSSLLWALFALRLGDV